MAPNAVVKEVKSTPSGVAAAFNVLSAVSTAPINTLTAGKSPGVIGSNLASISIVAPPTTFPSNSGGKLNTTTLGSARPTLAKACPSKVRSTS